MEVVFRAAVALVFGAAVVTEAEVGHTKLLSGSVPLELKVTKLTFAPPT